MAMSAERKHQAPCSNKDYDFFYEGLDEGTLLIQRCDGCGTLRNPPSPMCGGCQSIGWTAARMSGAGRIHSFTIHRHPPLPDFPTPHPIAVVDLAEGVRFVGAMDGTEPERLAIGGAVEAQFIRRGEVASVRFRLA